MFRKMSEIELIIREIDNVRMIDIYEMTGIKDDPEEGCAAISVFYGGDKHINLCELDSGFMYLVGKVFEIYGKSRGAARGILAEGIIMDEKTRQILESGWELRDESFLEPYYDLKPTDIPDVGFESADSARFIPMISYMLQGLYMVTGKKLEITGSRNGWRGTGIIYGLINGTRIPFAVKINQVTEERFNLKVNNFLVDGGQLEATISIENRQIVLNYKADRSDFKGISIFNLHENGYSENHEAYLEGRKIFADTWGRSAKEAVRLSEDERKLLPWDCGDSEFHSLPWGMIFAYKKEVLEHDGIRIEENKCCHVYKAAGYSDSVCWTRIINTDTKVSLDTSSIRMQRLLIPGRRLQTYFVPCIGNHSEKYERNLEDRYFISQLGIIDSLLKEGLEREEEARSFEAVNKGAETEAANDVAVQAAEKTGTANSGAKQPGKKTETAGKGTEQSAEQTVIANGDTKQPGKKNEKAGKTTGQPAEQTVIANGDTKQPGKKTEKAGKTTGQQTAKKATENKEAGDDNGSGMKSNK